MPPPEHSAPRHQRPTTNTSRPSTPRPHHGPRSTTRPAHSRPRRAQARSERSPVPATVWPHTGPPIETRTGWPAPIITQLLQALTQPDDHVLLLPAPDSRHRHGTTPDGSLAAAEDTVREHGRRVDTVLLDPPTAPAAAPSGASVLDAAPLPGAGREYHHAAATGDHDGHRAPRADLVLTHLTPQAADGAEGAVVEQLAGSAARLLTAGGIFAVITHSDQSGGVLRDPTGPVIAAGQQADLLYLQHLVLLLTPIQHSQLTPPPETGSGREQPLGHHRVHADAVLFTRPSSGTAEPESTAPGAVAGAQP